MNTLKTNISLFSNAFADEPDEAITLEAFFHGVKDGRWQRQVDILREHLKRGDEPRYTAKKRDLPAVTISCHCLSRERELSPEAKAITHSGWLQADFDLKDNPMLADDSVVRAKRAELLADPYVGAVFVGPSGQGLKAVVSIDTSKHKDSWFAAELHFREKHRLTLDKATKDPMRLCFVSYDPDMETSEDFQPIPVPDKMPERQETWRPPVETTAADIAEMLRFIPPRPDYDTWLKIASAVWSVLPMVDGARLLHQWSPEEKEGEYAGKHKSRLKQVGVGTLAHLASQHGFDARAAWKRKRWAGQIRFADSTSGPGQGEDPLTGGEISAIPTEISRERVMVAYAQAHKGDARLWAELRRGLRVWNIHAKTWMVYEDGLWRRDTGNSTILDISDTLTDVYQRVADSIRAEMAANPADEDKKDPRLKEIKGLEERCHKLCHSEYLGSVERIAKSEMNLPATAFDANPEILVVLNGTLDFSEGIFRGHRASDYATTRSPINFDLSEQCPKWDAFLKRFIPDVETRVYLARAFGYSLTGRVHHDALFFAYGKGANGKSTLFGVLKILLGDLMTTVPIAALLAAKSDNNFDYYKASMEGKRVVLTDEIPEGRKLADSQVKAITGGDAINARRPFEQPYAFFPTHKLWLMGNHKPDVQGTDEGIWRRVHMIPFTVTIPENERRERHEILGEFEAEAAGILNWAIRGLLESRDIGLKPPPQVVEATRNYREESDQFGSFLIECTEKDITGRCGIGSLAKTYAIWCDQNNEQPRYRGTRQLRKVMSERGYHIEPDRNDHPTIHGIKLKLEEKKDAFGISA